MVFVVSLGFSNFVENQNDMGYQTSHELLILKRDNQKLVPFDSMDIITELREFSEEADYALDDSGETNESCKWYDHEKELREFSTRYPDLIFKLHGEGEEAGDLWDEWYKDGKMQKGKAIITYPDFDQSKLS